MGPRLLSFPYYDSNPYLTMLGVAPRAADWEIVQGVKTLAQLEKQAVRLGHGDVLHVHWTAPVLHRVTSPEEAWERAARFEDVLTSVRSRGGHVLWTVHNALAHDAEYLDVEIAVAKMLAGNADRIIQLNPATADEVVEHYQLREDKIVDLPHSSYLGVYPDEGNDARSRERVGVPPEVPTVGFIGLIRAYKGLDVLCRAVEIAEEAIPGLTFVVAGQVVPTGDLETVSEMLSAPNVVKSLDFVAATDYSDWMRSCDVVALPYRRILNSGSLLAAGTFERTCLVPADTSLARQFEGQQWVVSYEPEPDEATALAAAITEALHHQEARRAAAREFARSYTPYDMSRDYLRLLEMIGGEAA